MKENILSYSVDTGSAAECTERIFAALQEQPGCSWLACLNPHSCVVAERDEAFKHAIQSADWLLPDGIGVVLASRLLGGSVKDRVTGSDIFASIMSRLDAQGGKRIFFLGSTTGTLDLLKRRVAAEFPGVEVAGTYSPPFRDVFSPEEEDAMVRAVNAAGADVLWVGMTAPKQEKWIWRNRDRLDVRFAAAVGAVFDFYTKATPRSSAAMQRAGLEWLPRLVRQPRRLWRRTVISAPIFMVRVMRERLSSRA
jgi:N-acetylglucosaminyldiphosphoundecaprenol N-acetyl-beta-D-mannosaminyltransferase